MSRGGGGGGGRAGAAEAREGHQSTLPNSNRAPRREDALVTLGDSLSTRVEMKPKTGRDQSQAEKAMSMSLKYLEEAEDADVSEGE